MSTLDNFVISSKPLPRAMATSQLVRDRGSIFEAAIYRSSSASEVQSVIRQHTEVVHGEKKASHEIAAWRYMSLKHGKDGLGGPDDFEVKSGSRDDGENGAGKRALSVMESEGIIDAVVIVSRWCALPSHLPLIPPLTSTVLIEYLIYLFSGNKQRFGGTMLGPIRFTHIELCAQEVCHTFKLTEEVEIYIEELKVLDIELAQLRSNLAAITSLHSNSPDKNSQDSLARLPDYDSMLLSPPDLLRAQRLITARRNAIASVKTIIEAKKG